MMLSELVLPTHMCECGQKDETVQHVLLRRPRYVEARRIMKKWQVFITKEGCITA